MLIVVGFDMATQSIRRMWCCSPVLVAFASLAAWGQNASDHETHKLEFEVASIKPSVTGLATARVSGGPETSDPGQISYRNVTLRILILNAYKVKNYQIAGPDYLSDVRVNIVAKVPAGVSKDDSRVMLQNLLMDRFGLKVHRERKEMQAYTLVVGKRGAKLRASALTPAEDAGSRPSAPVSLPGRANLDKDGFPVLAGGRGMALSLASGRIRMTVAQGTAAGICDLLSNQLNRPVIDETGLDGKYDFHLEFATEKTMSPPGTPAGAGPGDPAPDLMAAVEEQLGLRLESKTLPIDTVVVDHMERTATQN